MSRAKDTLELEYIDDITNSLVAETKSRTNSAA